MPKELQRVYEGAYQAQQEALPLARRWTNPMFNPFNELERGQMLQSMEGEMFRQRPLDELQWRQAASKAYGQVPQGQYMKMFDPEKGQFARQRVAGAAVERAALAAIEAKKEYAQTGAQLLASMAGQALPAAQALGQQKYQRDVDAASSILGVSQMLGSAAMQMYLADKYYGRDVGTERSFTSYVDEENQLPLSNVPLSWGG